MKLILIAVLATISFCSKGQLTRSVYTTTEEGTNRATAMTEINGQMVFVSVKESKQDTLLITTFWMDDEGETSGYLHRQILGISGEYFSISGVGVTSNNELEVAIMSTVTSDLTMRYFKVDPSSQSSASFYEYPTVFRAGYVRTREKGDSLITYLCTQNDLIRLGVATDNPSGNNSQIAAVGVTYSSSAWIMGRKSVELIILPNGTEYIGVNNDIIKRTSTGYTMGSSSVLIQMGITFDVDDQGNVLLLSGSSYALLDDSLMVTSEGPIPSGDVGINMYGEVIWENGYWSLYHLQMGGQFSYKTVLDQNINTVAQFPLAQKRVKPYDLHKRTNGDIIIVGSNDEVANLSGWVDPASFSVSIMQHFGQQPPGTFIEYGQIINHSEQEFNTGHLNSIFSDRYTGFSGLDLEHNGTKKSMVYAASNSLIGLDNANDTVGMLLTYGDGKISAGPFTPEMFRSHESIDKHNRGYYVDQLMIDLHLWSVTNNPSYNPPFAIKQWPAHGNPSLGQSQDIAPFFDQNGNGTYEPLQGDYPSIYGDRCVLNVFYQNELDTTISSNGSQYGMECLQYLYVYDCDTSEVLNSTVFVNQKFKITNGNINDAYIGSFIDTDVGNAFDDFVGTNVELGMVYGYNGDLYDENNAGAMGFNDTLPAVGVMVLRGAKLSDDGLDNMAGIGTNQSVNGFGFGDGITDNEYFGLESSSMQNNGGAFIPFGPDYYEVFQGLENGSYIQVNGVDVRHAHFGNSDPLYYSSWGADHGNNYSEITSGHQAGDRRIIGSTGPYNLDANDPTANSIEIVTAYITAIDTVNIAASLTDPLDHLFMLGQELKSMYAQNQGGCASVFDQYITDHHVGIEELEMEAYVYPNPAKDKVYINVPNASNYRVEVYDLQGRQVYSNVHYQNSTGIQVSDWNSGIFVIHITTELGNTTKKLIH
ncbi:MAG: T9SS type A sorting domain-containing protein [Crocinitomicaceae bacterium]|nr:T9SS type A sorting domain-containing protein [Crocinitomicaceae bacterium]